MAPVVALTLAFGASAQDEVAELVHKRDAKLAEPWVELAPWSTDLDRVRARAKDEGKLIFAYFTRSYAP